MARDATHLIESLVLDVCDILGESASYTMFHHGAVEEGRRLAKRHEGEGLEPVLQEVQDMLSRPCQVVRDDGDTFVVRIDSPDFDHIERRALQGVLAGLFEGAVGGARNKVYTGRIEPGSASGARFLTIELRAENDIEQQVP